MEWIISISGGFYCKKEHQNDIDTASYAGIEIKRTSNWHNLYQVQVLLKCLGCHRYI